MLPRSLRSALTPSPSLRATRPLFNPSVFPITATRLASQEKSSASHNQETHSPEAGQKDAQHSAQPDRNPSKAEGAQPKFNIEPTPGNEEDVKRHNADVDARSDKRHARDGHDK